MFIDLASVGTSPKRLKASLTSGEIDLGGEAFLKGEAKFDGEAVLEGGKTHVRGVLSTEAILPCTRCLAEIERRFEIAFDDVFLDENEESGRHETELGGVDLDESLVIGGKVDIADIVREQILLALPEQVFCKEDCRGLCPKCGGNRNLIDCNCDETEIDPRWAALKDL